MLLNIFLYEAPYIYISFMHSDRLHLRGAQLRLSTVGDGLRMA